MKKSLRLILFAGFVSFIALPYAYSDSCEEFTQEWIDCVNEGCDVRTRLLIMMDIAEYC